MKNRTTALVLLLCAAGLPAVAANVAETMRPRPVEQLKLLSTAADLEWMRKGMAEATPLTSDEVNALSDAPIPPSCDYSKYLTLIRQQGAGGCGTMATLAILDILKEKERPYSPDFSYRFAEYVYNLPGSGNDQMKVLKESGCCSEASLPTNYDPPGAAVPSTANYNEARMYRLASSSKPKKPSSVDELKRLLFVHGPLFAIGDTPDSATHGHCFAIVGYDDSASSFTIVNSFGDRWQNGGLMKMPYANIKNPPATQTSPRLDWFTYVDNAPTPAFAHPYTARVKIHHDTTRQHLTVKIGVEGKTPAIVWERPNRNGVVIDGCQNLVFDFPMPAYANDCWPPSETNQWYVEVTDDFPVTTTQSIGVVQEVTLVKRLVQGNGTCLPILIRPSAANFPIPMGGAVKIYIPARKYYALTLSADRASAAKGETVKFSGRLNLRLELSSNNHQAVPQANRDIQLRKAKRDPIEGTVVYSVVGTARTDANGQFSLSYAPDETSDYQAFANKPDGAVDATSNVVSVSIGSLPATKQIPQTPRIPRF